MAYSFVFYNETDDHLSQVGQIPFNSILFGMSAIFWGHVRDHKRQKININLNVWFKNYKQNT